MQFVTGGQGSSNRPIRGAGLDSGGTPKEACRACPELLRAIPERRQRLRSLEAQIGTLFPEQAAPTGPGRTPPMSPPSDLPRIPGYEVQAVLRHG